MREEYNKLKKKFSLPEFEKLDFDFEITAIEEPQKFLLRNIRRKIMEKLDYFTKIIEDMLQAEPMLPNVYECRFFTDEEKVKIFDLYKNLMRINREGMLLMIDDGEEADAQFIKEIALEYPKIQESLRKIASKAIKGWIKEPTTKEELGYLG